MFLQLYDEIFSMHLSGFTFVLHVREREHGLVGGSYPHWNFEIFLV